MKSWEKSNLKKFVVYTFIFFYSISMSFLVSDYERKVLFAMNFICFLSSSYIYFIVIKFFTEIIDNRVIDEKDNFSSWMYLVYPLSLVIRYILIFLNDHNYIFFKTNIIYIYVCLNVLLIFFEIAYFFVCKNRNIKNLVILNIPFIIYILLDTWSLKGALYG